MSRYKIHTKAKEFSLHAFGGQTYELGTDDEKETVYDLKKFILTDIFPQENIELYRVRLIIKPNIELTNVQGLHKLEDKDIYLLVDEREIGRLLTTYGNTTLKEPKGMCLVENVFYLIAENSIYRVDRTNSDKVEYFSARKKNIPDSQEPIDNMVSIRYPQDICFSEQRKELYIAEQNTIKVCSTDGLLIREFGTILKNCRGICIAEQTNNIYVTDISKKAIFVFSLEGEFIHAIEGIIDSPCGVCFSKKENGIYVINNQYKNRSII